MEDSVPEVEGTLEVMPMAEILEVEVLEEVMEEVLEVALEEWDSAEVTEGTEHPLAGTKTLTTPLILILVPMILQLFLFANKEASCVPL